MRIFGQSRHRRCRVGQCKLRRTIHQIPFRAGKCSAGFIPQGLIHNAQLIPCKGVVIILCNRCLQNPFGLGKVGKLVPAAGYRNTAKGRITGQEDEAPVSPEGEVVGAAN